MSRHPHADSSTATALAEVTLEVIDLVDEALPIARQLLLMAEAVGPASGAVAAELVALLEAHQRHYPPKPEPEDLSW